MPTRDLYHDAVIAALKKDGWSISHDPYLLPAGDTKLYVDLEAERLIAAERPGERIAVEIKTFSGRSEVRDLEQALGQYLIYRLLLAVDDPERVLHLAVTEDVFTTILDGYLGRAVREDYRLRTIAFDPDTEVIKAWS